MLARGDACTIHEFAVGNAIAPFHLDVFHAQDCRAEVSALLLDQESPGGFALAALDLLDLPFAIDVGGVGGGGSR